MNNTELVYLDNYLITEFTSTVISSAIEDERTIVLLDKTIFYPQGGGQPYDQGVIEGKSGKFIVEEVRFVDGAVNHIGHYESEEFSQGDEVLLKVDKDRRELNSRLHSAGHLIDMAVNALKLGWTPGKGYHFPNGPYVEYIGQLGETDKEKLEVDMEKVCKEIVESDLETKAVFVEKEKMSEICNFVPEFLPEGKPGRVILFGDFGVPCGGTHVKSLKELGAVTVRKIKQEGSNVRIGYDISS